MSVDFDRSRLRMKSVGERSSKVSSDLLFRTPDGSGAVDFVESLPDVLAVREMRTLAVSILDARERGASRILMYGGHVIKCGLGPLLVKWMNGGRIDCLATNGAGTIHDVEMALFGETSEDVGSGIADGSFGMWEETCTIWSSAVDEATSVGFGLGEALGTRVISLGGDPSMSPLVAAVKAGRPVTVHPALGGDIVHPCPALNWAGLGAAAERDFDTFGSRIASLRGGVVINAGSAVVMPEVFLKLLTCARNLGHDVGDFTAASFDMMRQYRPLNNVVHRPVAALGGTAVEVTGSHELMLPLLDLFMDAEEERRK